MNEIHTIIQDALAQMEARQGKISELCEDCPLSLTCAPEDRGYIRNVDVLKARCEGVSDV